MANNVFNFEAAKGRDRQFKVRFPYDITGNTYTADFREKPDQVAASGTFTVTADTVLKEVTVHLTNAVSGAVSTGVFVWELVETTPANFKRSVVKGTMTLKDPGR